jgi:hypothetical protein
MSIKVGDLVMIVKPKACCGKGKLGYVFTVHQIDNTWGRCVDCGYRDDGVPHAVTADGFGIDLERLIKIDRPALPESLEREKELSV